MDDEQDPYVAAFEAANATRTLAYENKWSLKGAEDLAKVVHMAELARLLGLDLSETS
jgi:hypothetical protein